MPVLEDPEPFQAPAVSAEHGDVPDIDQNAADCPEGIVSDSHAKPEGKRVARHRKNRGGRPSKWTPEVAFRLGLVLADQLTDSPQRIAERAGIGRSTLWRWYRQGQAGDPRFKCLVPVMEEYEKKRRTWWGYWGVELFDSVSMD
jgi:hypothetical protein